MRASIAALQMMTGQLYRAAHRLVEAVAPPSLVEPPVHLWGALLGAPPRLMDDAPCLHSDAERSAGLQGSCIRTKTAGNLQLYEPGHEHAAVF